MCVLFDLPHHSILSFPSVLRLHLFQWHLSSKHMCIKTCSEAQSYVYPITSNKADNCSHLKWNPSSHCCVKLPTLCQISLFLLQTVCIYRGTKGFISKEHFWHVEWKVVIVILALTNSTDGLPLNLLCFDGPLEMNAFKWNSLWAYMFLCVSVSYEGKWHTCLN